MAGSSVLVIDVGTSSVRSARVDSAGSLLSSRRLPTPPDASSDGRVAFDPSEIVDAAVETATAILADGPVVGVGIAVQRASTVVWNRETGDPLAPGVSWQDLRTVGRCLELRAQGLHVAPNATATKAEMLLAGLSERERRTALVGTLDSWLVWKLTGGDAHVTDATNAGVTGLVADGTWDDDVLEVLDIGRSMLPAIVDTTGQVGEARVLRGAPPVLALVGDQQASLIGQGCVRPGQAKITFGTGGMLDQVASDSLAASTVTAAGCYPIVAWRSVGVTRAAVEAIMLAAGAHVDWLRDGLGLVAETSDIDPLAASASDDGDVVFVPALSGLGTPYWDHGARGTLLGLTRGTTRAQVVRSVLAGIAQRGVDLVDAAEKATGQGVGVLRVDGGLSRSAVFVQLLATAAERPVLVSDEVEATARGAGLLAGVAANWWRTVDTIDEVPTPGRRVEPEGPAGRERWKAAVERARSWVPELSALRF